ncbi:Tripartite-type tricarboxylate transporter, receptor component TctC [Desulfotomaculum arcticum]|uniref:Tripartite-type tricarboxylate transporter, receptor component TctC n=1 Tax=Desulfotruncus arcticus DSM 17038 TaxID=1121424 RepID=A0A1I2PGL1_9FIRM|nr:tripartite tricarboxylate transporter substrate binding protein [Desulfotruncus arcticus]SFG14680.1 Tripartite-type tricarboxylate transporter, receptor component TctC [Desulfotomaculum arcticum] [Desulfotruncus arcticus DSM 17038]
MKFKRGILVLVCIAAIAALLAGCGQGSTDQQSGDKEQAAKVTDYPNKPITIIVHSSPGAGADLFGRQAGKALQNVLGKPVVVENRTGGSGAVALQYVADSRPDGYTLIGMTDTLITTPLKNSTPKSIHDLVPVARLVLDGDVIYVNSDSNWDSQSVLDAIKGGSAKFKLGSPQVGSPESIAVNTLLNQYKANINAVTYGDGSEALMGVLAGDIDAGIAELAEILPQLEAGKVKVVLAFNSERNPAIPDIPTFVESGYPDVIVDKFRGFSAPKGTPQEVIDVLQQAFQQVMDDPDYKKAYTDNQQIPAYQNSADFQAFLDETEAKYKTFFDAQK